MKPLSSNSDSEVCQVTSSNYVYLADLLQKQVKPIISGSYLFNFLTDTNINSSVSPIPSIIVEFFIFSIFFLLFLYVDDFTIWSQDQDLLTFSKSIVYFFHFPYREANPEQVFVSPPLYITLIIFVLSMIEYLCFFLYKSQRFLEPYIQYYFVFLSETLMPFLLAYCIIASISSIANFIYSDSETAYLHWLIPIFSIASFPALFISIIRTFSDIQIRPIAYVPNDPCMALLWYFSLVLACSLESLLTFFTYENDNARIFISILNTFLLGSNCLLAFKRFFLSKISQILCLAISLIGCLNSFLCFIHTFVPNANPLIWLIAILTFDFIMIIVSIVYVLNKIRKIDEYIILNSGFISNQLSPREFIDLFSYGCIHQIDAFDDQNVIDLIFRTYPTSYRLQIFILRFLLSKKNALFVYNVSNELLKINIHSFFHSFQTHALLIISAELLNKNESYLYIREKQLLLVLRDCVKAHAKFWRAILYNSPGDIYSKSILLLNKIENATKFYDHNNIKEHKNDRYGQDYVDFLLNISFNYDKYLKYSKGDENQTNYNDNDNGIKLDTIESDSNILLDEEIESPDKIVEKQYKIYKNATDYKPRPIIITTYILAIIQIILFLVCASVITFSTHHIISYTATSKKLIPLNDISSGFMNASFQYIGYKLSGVLNLNPASFQNRNHVISLINFAKDMNFTVYYVNSHIDEIYINDTMNLLLETIDYNYTDITDLLNSNVFSMVIERVTDSTNMILRTVQDTCNHLTNSKNIAIDHFDQVAIILVYMYIPIIIIFVVSLIINARELHAQCVEALKVPKPSISSVYHYFLEQLPFNETNFLTKTPNGAVREFFAHFKYFVIFIIQLILFEVFVVLTKYIIGKIYDITSSYLYTGVAYPYYYLGLYHTLYLCSSQNNRGDYRYNIIVASRVMIKMTYSRNETDVVPSLNMNDIQPIAEYVEVPVTLYNQHPIFKGSTSIFTNELSFWLRKAIFAYLESLLAYQYNEIDISITNIDAIAYFQEFADVYMSLLSNLFRWSLASQQVGYGFLTIILFLLTIFLVILCIRKIFFVIRNTQFINKVLAIAPIDSPYVDPDTKDFITPIPPPPLGTLDLISNLPIGFVTFDKKENIIDANEAAQNFYDGVSLFGENKSDFDFTVYDQLSDNAQRRTFVTKDGLMKHFPYMYPYEEIEGYSYSFINETTNLQNKKSQFKKLNHELKFLHKILLPATVTGSIHNFEIDQLLVLEQFCIVDIEFSEDLPDEEFLNAKESIYDVANQYSTLFFVKYNRLSAFAIFSSFNVRSHQRQYIKESLHFAEYLHRFHKQTDNIKHIKIGICLGQKCISRLINKNDINITIHSKSNYKSSKLLRHAEPGEIIIEKDLLNNVTDVEINYTKQGSFSFSKNNIEYVILDKIVFND